MDWMEIFGWVMVFSLATNLCYRKGVRSGIKHALMILDLDVHQIEKLNKELEKDSHDLAMKSMKLN
jgi:hypothetical protein